MYNQTRSKTTIKEGIKLHRSVISGNPRYDKHKQKRDNEFNRKCLGVSARWKCSWKLVLMTTEY